LTETECDSLIQQAAPRVAPIKDVDVLQHTMQADKFKNTERVYLWQGMLQGPERKAVEERIEQVTGFPANHFSDWTVDKLKAGSYWEPHFDVLAGMMVPMATITVFLSATTENSGGEIVYPSTKTEPVMIRPVQGMAVVHHNTDEKHEFDRHSLHALNFVTSPHDFYVATKYILPLPVSTARRVALPVFAAATGGRLPSFLVKLHDALTEQFGPEKGGLYFDKLCVFVPVLIILVIVQYVAQSVHQQMKGTSSTSSGKKASTPATTSKMSIATERSKKKSKKKD